MRPDGGTVQFGFLLEKRHLVSIPTPPGTRNLSRQPTDIILATFYKNLGSKDLRASQRRTSGRTKVTASRLHVTNHAADESNTRTARRFKVRMAMRERFTVTELCALRNDLIQGGMVDSREAAELLQVFLAGRGYGVSQTAAIDAASRVEMAGCSLPVLERELEGLALVM